MAWPKKNKTPKNSTQPVRSAASADLAVKPAGPDPSRGLKIVQEDPYLEPYAGHIEWRGKHRLELAQSLAGGDLNAWALGHHYFGLHQTKDGWVFREWAPNASLIYLIGTFNDWQEKHTFELKKIDANGTWEIQLPSYAIHHGDLYKLRVYWPGGNGERIPSYAFYVVQDERTKVFSAKVWAPENPYVFKNKIPPPEAAPLIYEAHVGMAQIEGRVHTYDEFRRYTLPRIKKGGYNTLQLMAIQEHPYYGSFGYQVSSFFAPSSRFGTPDDLKRLIDEAHGMGLRVIMDIVHSHAVKNQVEGLGLFDGTQYQYFHGGGRGFHPNWGTMCFDYGKPQVMHFLLSNCKYWPEVFQFDGFRFDGVTSMLYNEHGNGKSFDHYGQYFDGGVDECAVAYFGLANQMLHEYRPDFITIAEDVSGMPGLACPQEKGGIGFDFRLGMGIPDFWIKTLKHQKDEDWSVDQIFHEHTNRRRDEKIISYCESHDQALVGDKTIAFWLMDAEMYWNMAKDRRNLIIDRGIALHKMIRMVTCLTARGGYLNFMGNEFGHPEWIDFPREGNGWSFHCARRQWNLVDDKKLCYHYLGDFDQGLITLARKFKLCAAPDPERFWSHCDDHILGIKKNDIYVLFNFHPDKSFTDYAVEVPPGKYVQIFNTDASCYGGQDRLPDQQVHVAQEREYAGNKRMMISLYLPARTALVLQRKA